MLVLLGFVWLAKVFRDMTFGLSGSCITQLGLYQFPGLVGLSGSYKGCLGLVECLCLLTVSRLSRDSSQPVSMQTVIIFIRLTIPSKCSKKLNVRTCAILTW